MREPFAIFWIVEPATLSRRVWKRDHHRTLAELLPHARLQRTRTQKAHDRKLTDGNQHARSQHSQLRVEPVRAVGDAGRRRAKVAGAARIASWKTSHQRRDVRDAAKFLGRLETRAQHPAVQLLPARPEKGRRDSRSTGPGAWPTRRNFAPHSPEKVGVASAMMPWSAQTVHRRQAAWWAANAAGVAELKSP